MRGRPKWTPGTYAVEAGRTITIDGVPFVSLTRCLKPKERGGAGYFSPVACDYFTRLAAGAPKMAEALRLVVRMWDDSFKGQETGYEGTELEDVCEQARAALRSAGLLDESQGSARAGVPGNPVG